MNDNIWDNPWNIGLLFKQGEEHEAEGELGDYRKDRNNPIKDIQIKECDMRKGRA